MIYLFIILLFFSFNGYAGDPLIQLIEQETLRALCNNFGFNLDNPSQTFFDRCTNDNNPPILFFSSLDNQIPFQYQNMLFIPFKKFDKPKEFLEALSVFKEKFLDATPNRTGNTFFTWHCYNQAAELTEHVITLFGLLERHPNNSQLVKKVQVRFEKWNHEILHSVEDFVKDIHQFYRGRDVNEDVLGQVKRAQITTFAARLVKNCGGLFAIDENTLRNCNLSQLKDHWWLGYNHVIWNHDVKGHNGNEALRTLSLEFLPDEYKHIETLEDRARVITNFDRIYGKRFVIFTLIAASLGFFLLRFLIRSLLKYNRYV